LICESSEFLATLYASKYFETTASLGDGKKSWIDSGSSWAVVLEIHKVDITTNSNSTLAKTATTITDVRYQRSTAYGLSMFP
jgi:head-tail adaptor